MRALFASAVLALCLASPDAFALKKTIIDSRLDACLEKANTTADMIRCNGVESMVLRAREYFISRSNA